MTCQGVTRHQQDVAAKREELRQKIRREEAAKRQNFEWILQTDDIGFWEVMNESPSKLYWFQIVMDTSNWQLLAEKLGLKAQEIQWCSWHHKDGPTFAMFYLLHKKGELKSLSLKDVLTELKNLGRLDVLTGCGLEENIEHFRALKRKNSALSEAATPCLPEYNYGTDMQSISMGPATLAINVHRAPEVLVNAANIGRVQKLKVEPPKSNFAVRILMIFASDAREEALKTAEYFRQSVGERKAIGVMTLIPPNTQAIADSLIVSPANSIHKWFKQVHFVVPVLSPKFLLQIQARDPDPKALYESQYNRYIYRFLQDDYVANCSRNYKCRPVYPQKYCMEVRNSELVRGNGLLQMHWNCSSEETVEELGIILTECVKANRKKAKQNKA